MVSPWYDSALNSAMITFGTIPVFTFPIIIAFGVGLGLFWSVVPVSDIPDIAWLRLNTGTITLAGALVGGRTATVLLNWSYYNQHWVEIPQIWLGGMSWVGALSGGVVAVFTAAWYFKNPVVKLADDLLPLFTSVTASAWLACWVTGYAYGVETQTSWGIPARDEWGTISTRWPTHLFGALGILGVHWIVDHFKARGWVKVAGLATSLQLVGFSVLVLTLSRFQGDPRPLWRGVPIATWFSIGVLILSMGAAGAILLRIWIIRTKSIKPGKHEN